MPEDGTDHPGIFDADWDDVRAVIGDLEADGYEVVKFGGSSSQPIPEKDYYLTVVRRGECAIDTGLDRPGGGD